MYVTAVDGRITKSTNKYLPVDMARIHKSSSILCFVFLLNINVMYLAADNNCSIESIITEVHFKNINIYNLKNEKSGKCLF